MGVESVQRSHAVPSRTGHEPEPQRARRPATSLGPQIAQTHGRAGLVASHGARTSHVTIAPPSPMQIQKRLETYLGQMSGPYTVGGKRVSVPAGFRMEGGMNQEKAVKYLARIAKVLPHETYRRIAADAACVVWGKGTPAQVRRVTQALIDSPAFKPYAKLAPESAVRHMAWDYGVGVDCSGYVHSAFLYARGAGDAAAPSSRYGLGSPGNSRIQNPPSAFFRKLEPADARAGDVIKLSSGPDGSGHKVIVMANDVLEDPERAQVAKDMGSTRGARIHVITVASSWGANGNPDNGGVKQELWAYDESSKRWATVVKLSSNHLAAFPSRTNGPYDHTLDGVYRPRAEN